MNAKVDALQKRALERRLREAGASKAAALAAVARGWKFRWIAVVSPRLFLAVARTLGHSDG